MANVTGNSGDNDIIGTPANDVLQGLAGDDALFGGGGADRLEGGTGHDALFGGDGNDVLDGSDGNDVLIGGAGDDILRCGSGRDIVDGGDGDDVIYLTNGGRIIFSGGAGTDILRLPGDYYANTLYATETSDIEILDVQTFRLFGTDIADDFNLSNISSYRGTNTFIELGLGNDSFVGSRTEDRVSGGVGDDVLEGGGGADHLDGGSGWDTASYAGAASAVRVNLASGSGSLGDATGDVLISIEHVIGSAFADAIDGDGGANTLRGLGGDDVLRGRGGGDRLEGGAGTDTATYTDAAGAIRVDLASGRGTLGDASGDVLVSIENVNGSSFSDAIDGTAGANQLRGFDGDDVLRGRGGADQLDGGAGTDTASYTDARSGITLDLARGSGTLGDASGDVLISIENVNGSNFADTISGDAGANQLRGFSGNDVLRGRGGADRLDGGDGTDTASYTDARSGISLDLGLGRGTAGDAAGDVFMSVENVNGTNFSDVIRGDAGANQLQGFAGNDVLAGGGGADGLRGGIGADRFVYARATDSTTAASGRDTIFDFSRAAGDKIDLTAFAGVFSFIGTAAFTGGAMQLHTVSTGAGLLVEADLDGNRVADFAILVAGVGSLAASDFLL